MSGDALPAQCIVCGHEAWQPRLEILVGCAECGYVRADLRIDMEEIRELYGASYFAGDEYADYLGERGVHRKNFARKWRMMSDLAGPLESVFEVGCAYGLWLEYLSEQGVRSAGLDLSEDVVAYARDTLGQDARRGDLSHHVITPGEFQAFVLWDTVEHLTHPEDVIARIVAALPSGGWIFLTTGDVDSRFARWRGTGWRMIHPPTHLHYFSRATLGQLLERHGLQVEEACSLPMYRNLRSTLANLQVLGRGLLARLAKPAAAILPERLQEKIGLWVDLGDIMFLAARKP